MIDNQNQNWTMRLIGGVALSVLILLSVSIWLVFRPYTVLQVDNKHNWPIENRVYHPGDSVFTLPKLCKTEAVGGEVSRMLQSVPNSSGRTTIVTYPMIADNMPIGCASLRVIVVDLPKDLPAGTYRVHMVMRYRVSPIRVVEELNSTEEFTVSP